MSKKHIPFLSEQVTKGEYYYLNLTPPKDTKEMVICGGREQCSPQYHIERDEFKFYSIEFVASGHGSITVHGETYPLRPGAIYCYEPHTSHIITTDSAQPMLKHFVDFIGSDIIDLLHTTDFLKGRPLYVSRPFQIRSIFENLITTGNTETPNRQALCTLLLRQLILFSDDNCMDPTSTLSPAWQTYVRCRQYIERHFIEVSTIQHAAEACFIDQAYLSRLFQRFTDESPHQLLTRLKMGKAADLLTTHDLLIKQVAEEIGYPDPYHFSRVFKRVYGISPKTFGQAARRNG